MRGILLLLLLLPATAFADGDGTLGQSSFTTGVGLGLSSQGVGLGSRESGGNSGTITINDIPAGATVVSASLYWSNTGNNASGDATAVFEGSPVAGTAIGTHTHTCWGYTNSFGFRADVTGTVTGNGNYAIRGIGNSPAANGNGASLVIIWDDPTNTDDAQILIYDGTSVAFNGTDYDETITISGFANTDTPSLAQLNLGVGDGQSFPDGSRSFNGFTPTWTATASPTPWTWTATATGCPTRSKATATPTVTARPTTSISTATTTRCWTRTKAPGTWTRTETPTTSIWTPTAT